MSVCSFVEKRRNRYYFRARLPVEIASLAGRTHVVASLGTGEARVAKINAAKIFLTFTSFIETMRLRMAYELNINISDLGKADALASRIFALGQEFEVKKAELQQEFAARFRALMVVERDDFNVATTPLVHGQRWSGLPPERFDTRIAIAAVTIACPPIPTMAACADVGVPSFATKPPSLPGWASLRPAFVRDKPGLTTKTIWSYNQAFNQWAGIIGDRPIGDIRRPDVKAYADFLRDKDSARGGTLNHKSIMRSLGHIKTFMAWAVAAGHAEDDRFETVTARDMTSEERFAGARRRAFTPAELSILFRTRLFTAPGSQDDQAAAWFLAIAALTGARTEEIALAPPKLVLLADVHCLDLREVGRKTCAAPRLVPLMPELLNMGLAEWADAQAKRGFSLVQPGPEQRTAAAWSKLLNRYLNANISDNPALVLYSLRHSFRQMLRAGNIGDELSDKIFGHSSGKVGAAYGRELSADEARLFVSCVRPPISFQNAEGQAYA